MSIKLLVGDKGNVDFEIPLEVTEQEKELVVQLFNALFSVVEVVSTSEFRKWRMGDNDRIQYPRSWSAEEYEVLLNCHSISEAIDKLARSGMSIIVQDGKWRPVFYNWCHQKGKSPYEGELIKIIKEFIKEKENEILKKRNKKKELGVKKKKLEYLKSKLQNLDSPKRRAQTELWMRTKKIQEDINELMQKKKKELQSEIEKLTEEVKSLDKIIKVDGGVK